NLYHYSPLWTISKDFGMEIWRRPGNQHAAAILERWPLRAVETGGVAALRGARRHAALGKHLALGGWCVAQRARDADPEVIGMVADTLQQAQCLGKDDVGFGVTAPRFQAHNVHLTALPVHAVELALRLNHGCCELWVVVLEGFQGLA